MSGPKRNPDKLNTIGVVVVGICGAVLVYVTIVALQAFYMNNTSELQTMADYGGQDLTAKGRKADEMRNISEAGKNSVSEGMQPTFRIPIEHAMKLVVEDAKKDPAHLVPALPRSDKASIAPVFGRPQPVQAGSEAPAGDAPAPAPTDAAGSAAPQTPTGAAGQPQPVPGTGGVPTTGAAQPKAPPPAAVQPKAAAPAQPKAAPAQPKAAAPAQPKAAAPAQPKAAAPAQPKNP